jgi:osmotically-inducible protein OsmY
MTKSMNNRFSVFASVLGTVLMLSACSPTGAAVGAGATLGVAAAQEGGITMAATDAAIRLQIHDYWFRHSLDMYRKLDMTVKEGRVLITGTVSDPDVRVDAVRLAWQANGVRQVINEINVENSSSIKNYVTDTWITGSLKTKLMLDKYVQSINYTIDTVNGTVYLMGIAQDQAELDRVTDHARNMNYVKNVVSYVRLRGEKPAGVLEPTGTEKL